ncbi:MAG: hypothetical protein IJ644_00980 [Oscillospiraceae bacterium]|nr:hypothetical protein [Oscillospiraceae bacterium]
MRLKNMLAVAAAFAFCTVSFASLAANAGEEKTIDCSNASDLGLGDEGNAVRRNIYNTWGNNVTDIDANTAVSEYISIEFTISGIGSDSARKDADSTTKYDGDGTNYVAFVGGSVAGTARHSITGGDPTDEYITISGDGTYTATWTLGDLSSENISCLYLQTNIDFTDYVAEADKETAEKNKDVAASGITLTINSIKTVEPDAAEETSESETNAETEGSSETDAATESTTKATTTTTAKSSTTTTTAKSASTTAATTSSTVTNTPTGDTSGIAVVASVLTAAGAAAVVSRKKK